MIFFSLRKAAILLSLLIFSSGFAASAQRLISYSYLGQFSLEEAQLALKKMPPLDSFEPKYRLNLYKIHYQTPGPDGQMTLASGLVSMPESPKESVGIVSYQHGTRFTRNDIPSTNNEKNHIYPALYSSTAGYMTVMADYLGLGDSSLNLHPYVQADTLASSCVDMLIASKELAARLDYPLNDKLFLAGYSEGGFSTLVMFESLAKTNQIPVTAVALGSAPYDWQETMRFILLEPGPRATAYLAYFFYSLQTYRQFWSNLDEIFSPQYSELIPVLFDGFHSVPEILAALPLDPRFIVQENLFNALLDGTDPHVEEFKNNFNHYYFTPTAPLLLVGTKGDKDVPYHGAELAYEVFKNKSEQVFIKSVSNTLDHIEAFPYALKEQLEFFKQYE